METPWDKKVNHKARKDHTEERFRAANKAKNLSNGERCGGQDETFFAHTPPAAKVLTVIAQGL
jgi:hypothetical protein